MVRLDVKKVGVIPDGGGWQAHGRGSEQARQVERAKNKGARAGLYEARTLVTPVRSGAAGGRFPAAVWGQWWL